MPSGRYARGTRAVGICERCSKKVLLKHLRYDGQFPDLKVCDECWDPKHPQEYLPAVTDPTTLYDPTGDPDRSSASNLVVSFPRPFPLGVSPLQIGVTLNDVALGAAAASGSFSSTSFDVTSFSTTSFSF